MTFDLFAYAGWALLFLRLLVAIIFFDSGRRHVQHAPSRSKSIGMSKGFTIFLGSVQMLGAVGLALGVLTQLAAFGLILIMLGAIQKKIVEWKSGFWGKDGVGWHYDLMLLIMNLVILTTAGGSLVLWP